MVGVVVVMRQLLEVIYKLLGNLKVGPIQIKSL